MNTTAMSVTGRSGERLARLADYLDLAKPRIAALELLVVTAAACAAGPKPLLLVHALLGTALIAASASAANQWLECGVDSRMVRTRNRSLPAGRLSGREVAWFILVTMAAGTLYLAITVNLLTAILGGVCWVLYVLVYTPLKRCTPANTAVGAVAGALPAWMGWTAMGQPWGMELATLLMILFLWQFPHFMAIAWIYRRDYTAAGLKMLTVVDPSGLRAGWQAVNGALLLLPVSMIPLLRVRLGHDWVYLTWILVLGMMQLAAAIVFFSSRSEHSAKWLLRASLLYLPAVLMLVIVKSLSGS